MNYDYLILSPGIGFKKNQINGYSIDDIKIPFRIVGQVIKIFLNLKKDLQV